jgi:hypothetical protein
MFSLSKFCKLKEFYGLVPQYLKLESTVGQTVNVDLNPSSSKSSYQDLPEEERQKYKDLLFSLETFNVSDHNLLCSLQCKKYFDLLMIMSNHR